MFPPLRYVDWKGGWGDPATTELCAAKPGRAGSVPELDGSCCISHRSGRLPSGYATWVAGRTSRRPSPSSDMRELPACPAAVLRAQSLLDGSPGTPPTSPCKNLAGNPIT
ncbi:hypothetical protein TherJR_0907 [Thermincola potens JR]|uniref:Uncharacterized protein n=1 Tax=Thermincola potens (strain JR) TaxID=635013 RepID=D5XDC5_THEPJ|nr:hypothetical protein TherJR_0907 [Thermincola potens JR]